MYANYIIIVHVFGMNGCRSVEDNLLKTGLPCGVWRSKGWR